MLLDRAPVPVVAFNFDERLLRRPVGLGPGSLVIASSTRGETAETARAAAAALHGLLAAEPIPVLLAAAVDAGSAACTTFGGFGHGHPLHARSPELAKPGKAPDPAT
jgi:hypothetical protein